MKIRARLRRRACLIARWV